MTTLNDTFERELTQEDEGYESGSKNLSISTPLRKAPQIYHISISKKHTLEKSRTTSKTSSPHK